ALIQFRRRRVFDPATTMRRRAQQAMKSARMDTAGHQSFLTGLYRALTAAIFARAGRLGEALTWHEAEAILHDHGVVPETAREAADLLRILESHKFSGVAPGQEEQGRLLTRTRDMLRRLGC
ncbi:MAG: hypothetical protein HKP58_17385, partial [Desulfatitalea sp.]|nr:hypothetical protein [Desulfatitalea sp.]NNK02187.1 hypothetical protein [Desulfatitalea sp.]